MGDSGSPAPERASPRAASRTETLLRLGLALAFLYLFLVGIKGLETGISAFGENLVDTIFDLVANPVAGLAAGILATALVQSSSVTTATIVGLVASGVVPVETAVPMVMGANIGTTITNSLASMGHIRQGAYFERAFAGAIIHDYFNLIAVAILLPLEIAFGLVTKLATAVAGPVDRLLPGGGAGSSPIKAAIERPIEWLADAIEAVEWQAALAPIVLTVGFGLIFVALWMITRQMKQVMSGRIENAINGILAKGAGLSAMAVGLVMTMAVQSSSITTSLLVPLVAAGVLTLANAFPVTLGANVGTTITALLASLATDSHEALVIALAHTVFNVLGILIVYPFSRVRQIPIRLAQWTAAVGTRNKRWLAAYVIGQFIVLPVVILLIA
jgi:solute carrier family 34 (sodium-dependent phosphate cotransporter)